jgi:hypothetical protein
MVSVEGQDSTVRAGAILCLLANARLYRHWTRRVGIPAKVIRTRFGAAGPPTDQQRNRYREFVPVCRSGMNSNRQFRFSNNLTTAGCLVRQRFDEPASLGVTEGPPGRSSRCSQTITESCRPEVPEPGLAVRIHFPPANRHELPVAVRLMYKRVSHERRVLRHQGALGVAREIA